MGHRALVLYERAGGRYDVHRSQWGAELDLRRQIAPGTPFGGRSGGDPAVDSTAIATGLTLREAVTEHLDFLVHEALYVVDADGEVREYRVLAFVVPTADGVVEGNRTAGRGAAVEVSPHDPGRGYVQGWFEAARVSAGELIDRGALASEDAVGYLTDRIGRFAGPDREVILDPAREGNGF